MGHAKQHPRVATLLEDSRTGIFQPSHLESYSRTTSTEHFERKKKIKKISASLKDCKSNVLCLKSSSLSSRSWAVALHS